ncbi:MAG: hypothetical protein ACFHU9_05800 [Fluviicola sp.]
MKTILAILFIFAITFSYTQSKGGKLLTKAETSFSKGKIKKAKRLTVRSEKAGFGFCSVTTAYEDLAILKAKIKAQEGLYYEAGQEISMTEISWNPVKMDSIQFYYYSLALGKHQLSTLIDSCLEEMVGDSHIYSKVIYDSIYLDIPKLGNTPIKITSFPIMTAMQDLEGDMNIGERFLTAIKEQEFYLQLH